LGYDTEPALRHIVRDLGYDPDMFLVKSAPVPPPAPPEMAAAAPMSPEGLPPELLNAAAQGGLAPEQAIPTEEQLFAGPAEELPPGAGLAGLI
jgi:hypothetical protein